MKILLNKNKDSVNSHICEAFGLSNSGKSTYLKKIQNNHNVSLTGHNPSKRIIPLFKFLLFNPIFSFSLYYKLNTNWIIMKELRFLDYLRIAILRNSYLSAVLARYNDLKNISEDLFVDEFFLQSIFMIYQKKAKEKEINKLLNIIPLPSKILLFEINNKTRYKRMEKNRFPAEEINKQYSVEWMKNSEYNFNIIKKFLLYNYVYVRNHILSKP